MSEPVMMLGDEDFGSWLGSPREACSICQSDLVNRIHKYRHEGVSLERLAEDLLENHNFSTSRSSLSRHFRYHFLVKPKSVLLLPNPYPQDMVPSSMDTLVSEFQDKKATFFDTIGYLAKSKMEQLKQYEEAAAEIEATLNMTSPEGNSGFANTDAQSDVLIKRWTYLQKEINIIKNELNSTALDLQKMVAKVDVENIKNHTEAVKVFILNVIVKRIANLLLRAREKDKIINESVRAKLAKMIIEAIKDLENEMTVDLLYQRAVDDMSSEKEI